MNTKKLLSVSIMFLVMLFNISAKAQENWTEWNITNQDYSDPQTKDVIFDKLPQIIDSVLVLNNKKNFGENNVLLDENKRSTTEIAYIYTLIAWCDYLKLSLCNANGLELISYDEAKIFDELFPKMNDFSIAFLNGNYTDGLSPTEYDYLSYKTTVEDVSITLKNMNEHININSYVTNPKTVPSLTSIQIKKGLVQENIVSDKNKKSELPKKIVNRKGLSKDTTYGLILILITIILIGLQCLFGKVRVKPILRAFLFALIFLSIVCIPSVFDGESFSDAAPFIAMSVLLFTLVTFPLYKMIDKKKVKNNQYLDFSTINKFSLKKCGIKCKLIAFITFILGPFALLLNVIIRFIYNSKRKQCENLRLYKKTEKNNIFFVTLQTVLFICFILIKNYFYSTSLLILFWLLSGTTGLLGVISIYKIIEYFDSILILAKSKDYFDFAEKYEISAKECNSILYLKRKKIEDYSYNSEQQVVLSYALHQINSYNAIGIQKFSKFYYMNLSVIFNKLDLRFTEEERKSIATVIASSYGNDKLDKIDLALASSLGLITGLMDVFLVGKPGDSKLQNFVDDNEERIVRIAAKISGYKGDSIDGAVKYLEEKNWVPYDKTKINEIGMGEGNHHLLSLAHANDIIGLLFAILDTRLSIKKTIENNGTLYRVVSCTYYKTPETIAKIKSNKNLHLMYGGNIVRLIEPVTIQSGTRIGNEKTIDDISQKCLYKTLYEMCKDNDEPKTTILCIIFGFVLWLFHLCSDRIGGSNTVKNERRGTGIAVPFQELFVNVDVNFATQLLNIGQEKLQEEFEDIVKDMFENGFDNRFFKTQKIPVLINEYLTKIVFIFKEIFYYKKELELKDIGQILASEGIIKTSSRAITGNSNFELEKTLTLSFSVFSVIDISDVVIRYYTSEEGGNELLSRINYPGLIKLSKESLSVFLSYLRRWSASPDKIIQKIEKLTENMVDENEEETVKEINQDDNEISFIDFVK